MTFRLYNEKMRPELYVITRVLPTERLDWACRVVEGKQEMITYFFLYKLFLSKMHALTDVITALCIHSLANMYQLKYAHCT